MPFLKKEDVTDSMNYRGIILTDIPSKTFTRIIEKKTDKVEMTTEIYEKT